MTMRTTTRLLPLLFASLAACHGGRFPAPEYPERTRVERQESKGALPAEYLSLHYDYELDAHGGWVRTVRQRYRLLTEEGVTGWGVVEAPWQPWYLERPEVSVTVTSPSGETSRLDPKTLSEAPQYQEAPDVYSDARVLRAPLPNVKVGSVVEETIVTRTKHPFLGNGYVHYARVEAGVAEGEVEIRVSMPEDLAFHVERRDAQVKVEETRANGRRVVTFRGGPYPALDAAEPMLPSDVPAWPTIAFSAGATWASLAAAYEAVVEQSLRDVPAFGVTEKIVKPSDDPRTKAEKIVAWIRKRVRYAGIEFGDSAVAPRKPTETLDRGYGDCKDQAVLLVGLLREAGVPARMALLRAGTDEDVLPGLPALNAFNHAIVVIPGDTPVWIDPTADLTRAGELPAEDQYRLALVIDDATRDLTRTPAPDARRNTYREERTVYLPELGPARVVEVTRATGEPEEGLRRSVAHAGNDPREGFASYVAKTYNAPRLGGFDAPAPSDLSAPFQLRVEAQEARVAVSDLVTADAIVDSSVVFAGVPSALAEGEERRADLWLGMPCDEELRYEVHPPAGFFPKDLPPPLTVELGPAKFERRVEARADGVVDLRYHFALPKPRWSAAEVNAFRKAYADVRKEPQTVVHFVHAGQKELEDRRPERALDIFQRDVKAHPTSGVPLARLGATLLELGFGASGRQLAADAVKLSPDLAALHRTRARILLRDTFGRPYHRGFDRRGAMAAFREVLRRDPTDIETQTELGVLFEHDDDGERYGPGSQLTEAIAQYDQIDPAALAAYSNGSYAYNALYDLLYAGRFEELRARLAKLPRERVPPVLALVAQAVLGGPNAGLAEAVRLGLPADTKAKTLDEAAGTLVHLRRYPEAAALSEAAASSSSDATMRTRANAQRRVKRVEASTMPDGKPEEAAAKALVSFVARPKMTDAEARAFVSARAVDKKKESVTLDTLKDFSRPSVREGLPPEVFADLLAAGLEASAEGNPASGYRVRMHPSFGTGTPIDVFMTREGGAWRVRAFGSHPSELGCEALRLARAGDKKGAAQWLEWARELVSAGAGEDPLRVDPFARLWPANRADVEVAAAALCARAEDADQAAPVLEAARGTAAGERQIIVDHALALAYQRLDEPKRVLDATARLEKAVPTSFAARALSYAALAKLGRYADIVARVKQYLATKPDDLVMLGALAFAEDEVGHPEEAYRAMEKVIKAGGAGPSDYNNQAWRSLFVGTVTERDLGYALRAVQAEPTEGNHLNTLAAVYVELGRTTDAVETLLKTIALRPGEEPNEGDYYVLGRIAERLGLTAEARAAYGKVTPPSTPREGTIWALVRKRLAHL